MKSSEIASTARATVLGSGVLLLLAACAVGPDYVKPKSELHPFHNVAAVQARQATLPAPSLEEWWAGFNDPALLGIVERALHQNLDLEIALARVQQARGVAKGASAQLLPTLDLGATASDEHASLDSTFGNVAKDFPGFNRNQREYTFGGTASWEIDLFGGLRRGAHAAFDEMQAAQADQASTRVTVAADAADAYLQIRGYQARLAVAQNQIDTDAHLLKLVDSRHELGAADGREVAEAQALLRQARSSLTPLKIALESQLNRLDILMGVQPGTYAEELSARAEVPDAPAIRADDPPLEVLRRRPDVIAAERRLAASSETIGAAISEYYPKISLSGVLGFDSMYGDRLFSHAAFQPQGVGALRWRLFDFGKVDAEVAQARGTNAEALAAYRKAVLKAAEDVENALINLSQTEANAVELREEVEALKRSQELSQKAYEAGSIALTDVLDADRELLTAQDQLELNRADAARAAVSVFRALGGGWKVTKDPAQVRARATTDTSG